jgi:hypothetical protein
MEKNKVYGLLTVIALVAAAALFTVCSASGAGVGGGADDIVLPQVDLWTVTFDADGGEPVPEPVTVADGETIGTWPTAPSKVSTGGGGGYYTRYMDIPRLVPRSGGREPV